MEGTLGSETLAAAPGTGDRRGGPGTGCSQRRPRGDREGGFPTSVVPGPGRSGLVSAVRACDHCPSMSVDRPNPIPGTPGTEPSDIEAEARRLLAEAKDLLESLRAGRATVEARMQEQGRVDAMRHVRGNSALDLAIDRTESMMVAIEGIRRQGGDPGSAG